MNISRTPSPVSKRLTRVLKVNWEDHQATFRDDLNNAFSAGNAPDVINLSISEGWVTQYASQGNLLALDDLVPQDVVATYFKNLWDQQLVDGKHYQFPYYQGINVDLVNKQIFEKAGLTIDDFPKTIDGLPALCKTIKDKTATLCDIRLTTSDLLAQMVYEGGVEVINKEGTAFTFDSPAAVEWLKMYVDMVKAGTVDRTALVTDNDRVGLDLFISGKAAFYATGPNLIREVRTSNPGSVRLPGCGQRAGWEIGRGRQGPHGDVGERQHQVPERRGCPGAVFHQCQQQPRAFETGGGLSVDAGFLRRSLLLGRPGGN